uniref:Apolipoprotein B mRNA editing enzyme, catalytic polypeptide-like 2a n=1 Tax=Cyprinus carpio TaxID=7962 RepID=A0A8C2B9C0_CYPCA
MADRKSSSSGGVSSRLSVRRKEKAENEPKKEEKPPKDGEEAEVNGTSAPAENREAATGNGATANGENAEKPEPMELPPFEIITGHVLPRQIHAVLTAAHTHTHTHTHTQLAAAGCKLRMMKPLDFTYTWNTFVENDEQTFTLWEDCQENYEYYQDKLADILQ